MEIETIVMLVVGAAAFVLAGVGVYVARKPTNITSTLDLAESTFADIERAAEAARQYVLAAEQLWLTGRLDKDNRLYWVVNKLQAVFPDISADTLEDTVEAAVAWIKMTEGKLSNGGEA